MCTIELSAIHMSVNRAARDAMKEYLGFVGGKTIPSASCSNPIGSLPLPDESGCAQLTAGP
ncbi:hypothetical protein BOSE21B_10155 [Bosea sp. 21B]|nr:hypothetical protein BOSE21B_10155 [Bosea sp. 21B]VXA94963.1 hypothetical protein BOSE127_10052 [Bosea sp. 127]